MVAELDFAAQRKFETPHVHGERSGVGAVIVR